MLTEDAAPPFALVEEPPPPRWRRNILVKLFILLVVMSLGAPLLAAIVAPAFGAGVWVADQVDERIAELTEGIEIRIPHFPERSKIFAADGTRLATIFLNENREVVRLRGVAPVARKAVLAAEDADFFEHSGIDYDAVLRAFVKNAIAGEIEQGASTITQQLARSAVRGVGDRDTFARKIREAWVATKLEERYTKNQILELYINDVYFGGGAYGIETAARRYFGKHASNLTLSESALLAGTIAAPTRFSPYQDPEAARRRRNEIIRRMRSHDMVSAARAQRARREPLVWRRGTPAVLLRPREPYFVEFVKREILSDPHFGRTREARERLLYQGGLEIHTTIEPRLQRVARDAALSHLPLPEDPENAVAAVNPQTGAIRTLQGSTNFEENEYDLASQGRRQTGSAFKIFTLVAALEAGVSPTRTYNGRNGVLIPNPGGKPDPWPVFNADLGSYGNITLQQATTNSVNAVYAQLIFDIGAEAVVETAHRMGITSELPAVPSLTLGTAPVSPLEMASANGTLANMGVYCKPFAVAKVFDRNHDPLFEQKNGGCEQVVDPDIAATAIAILKTVVTSGTGTAASLGGRPQFGKTGTTNNYADAWFAGCVVQLCTASWVGHLEELRPMTSVHGITVFGGTFPAQIWQDFMSVATADMEYLDWPAPSPFGPDTGPGRGDRDIILGTGRGGGGGGGGGSGDGGTGGSPNDGVPAEQPPTGGGGPVGPPPKGNPPPKTGGGPKSG